MYYYYQQYTITQIADLLELNENTVKSRLALARGKIRAALEEKEKKEGIKLYGIPLALTPILRQAMELFEAPEGMAERIWENISQAMSNPPAADISASQPSRTSGQNVQNSNISGSAANVTAEVAKVGVPVATKIIIGVIAAAVITAGVFIIPRLMNEPLEDTISENTTPPSVVTEMPNTSPILEETQPPTEEAPTIELDVILTPEQLDFLAPLEDAVFVYDMDAAFPILSTAEFMEICSDLPKEQGNIYKVDERGEWRLWHYPMPDGSAGGTSGIHVDETHGEKHRYWAEAYERAGIVTGGLMGNYDNSRNWISVQIENGNIVMDEYEPS